MDSILLPPASLRLLMDPSEMGLVPKAVDGAQQQRIPPGTSGTSRRTGSGAPPPPTPPTAAPPLTFVLMKEFLAHYTLSVVLACNARIVVWGMGSAWLPTLIAPAPPTPDGAAPLLTCVAMKA